MSRIDGIQAMYRIRGEKDSQYVQVIFPFPEVLQKVADLREQGWDVRIALVGMPEHHRARWVRK